MDTSIRPDIDARDIIARIMEEMEEVIGLIHRPSPTETTVGLMLPAEALAEAPALAAPDRA